MPIMIPPVIPDSASVSEKTIFETFKSVPQRNWEVLHGVKILPQNSPANPIEIDFVILMPGFVSVICLQVVRDESYKFENGQWSNSTGTSSTSPLEQAKNNIQDLKEHFKESHFSDDSPLSLGYAIAFPKFPPHLNLMTEGSKEPGDVLNPDSLSTILGEYAVDLTKELWEDWDKLTLEDWEQRHFPWEDGQQALNKLRSDLVSTGGTISTISTIFHDNLETHRSQLLRLTEDQFKVLQRVGCQPPSTTFSKSETVKEEPRCLVDGAAGTGKTILAIEIARQRCEAGKTVGMLCSNPYLSNRFEKWTKTLPSDKGMVAAGTPATLPSWAFRNNHVLKTKHEQRRKDFPDLEGTLKFGYLHTKWKTFIEETIKDLEQGGIFDYLIVDEAQNLCDKVFLELMDALLKGGLTKGHWTMFGDFTYQDIVSPSFTENGKDVLKKFCKGKICWYDDKLEINCRNTHEIATEVTKLVDIKSLAISGVHGPLVQFEYFDSESEGDLENHLDRLVGNLKERHFGSWQIILLSSGDDDDEFDDEREYSGWKLTNIRETEDVFSNDISSIQSEIENSLNSTVNSSRDPLLRYSDIYDFQGLESEVVILVLPVTKKQTVTKAGITLPHEAHLRKVLYTGMSRAKAMLIVVAEKSYNRTIRMRRRVVPISPSR